MTRSQAARGMPGGLLSEDYLSAGEEVENDENDEHDVKPEEVSDDLVAATSAATPAPKDMGPPLPQPSRRAPAFDGKNFLTWKVRVGAYFDEMGWGWVVRGGKPPSHLVHHAPAMQERARAILVQALDDSSILHLGDALDGTAKKILDALRARHAAASEARIEALEEDFAQLRLPSSAALPQFLDKFHGLLRELAAVGQPVATAKAVRRLRAALPEGMTEERVMLEVLRATPSFSIEQAEAYLRERMAERQRAAPSSSGRAAAMAASTPPTGAPSATPTMTRRPACYRCGGPGHSFRECGGKARPEWATHFANRDSPGYVPQPQRWSSPAQGQAQGQGKGHALVAAAGENGASHFFLLDSGASHHMIADASILDCYKPLPAPLPIRCADGGTLGALGSGTLMLSVPVGGGNRSEIELVGVLAVPGLTCSLLSVPLLARAGWSVIFSSEGCWLHGPRGERVPAAALPGGTHGLNPPVGHALAATAETWHARLGHPGEKISRLLVGSGLVKGLPTGHDEALCPACVNGKATRKPFAARDLEQRAAIAPLELVYSDVSGPMRFPSVDDDRYYVTFIDEATHFTVLYLMKSKDEVLACFEDFCAFAHSSRGERVRALHSDNGGEYTSNSFKAYCREKGIAQRFTTPHSPPSNGVAERLNRTLKERARCLMLHAHAPTALWGEALRCAVFLLNRTPTTALPRSAIPYTLWYGRPPSLKNLRVFGALAYHVLPAQQREGKFAPVAREAVLVGYEGHAYRLWLPEENRFIRSRDVVIDEKVRGFDHCATEAAENEIAEDAEGGCLDLLEPLPDEELATAAEHGGLEPPVQAPLPPPEILPEIGIPAIDEGDEDPLLAMHVQASPSANGGECEPETIAEAQASPEAQKWQGAMEEELASFAENNVWDLCELPPERKAVGLKWVYKLKRDEEGKVQRYKARLVAQGFSQRPGVDFGETYAPVARYETMRAVLAIACHQDLDLHQMDVKTAFLNGELQETIYVKQPKGFAIKGQEDKVYKLNKAVYGLKQASRAWYEHLDKTLKAQGLQRSQHDPCLYWRKEGDKVIYVLVYVDDLIIAVNEDEWARKLKEALNAAYDIKDLGELRYCLGMLVERDRTKRTLHLTQEAFITDLLRRYGMIDSKPVATPEVTAREDRRKGSKNGEAEDEDIDEGKSKEKSKKNVCRHQGAENKGEAWSAPRGDAPHSYPAVVGSLQYLAGTTRPDIAHVVRGLSSCLQGAGAACWGAVKRVLRYLNGTRKLGLTFKADPASASLRLLGYSDASFASSLDKRRSITGYLFLLSGGAISWRSFKQRTTALSTAEAEYMALSDACKEAVWLRALLLEIAVIDSAPVEVREDNQAAIAIAHHPTRHAATKHIDVRHHYVRECVYLGRVHLTYVASQQQAADILTKALARPAFDLVRGLMSMG